MENKNTLFLSGGDDYGPGKAVFSVNRDARFYLERELTGKLTINYILLNPSIANESTLDPTVTRCMNRALDLNGGKCIITNIFPVISTDPSLLYNEKYSNRYIETNIEYIKNSALSSDIVIAGWGKHGNLNNRGDFIKKILNDHGVNLFCLNKLIDGSPQHPLYISYDKNIIPF